MLDTFRLLNFKLRFEMLLVREGGRLLQTFLLLCNLRDWYHTLCTHIVRMYLLLNRIIRKIHLRRKDLHRLRLWHLRWAIVLNVLTYGVFLKSVNMLLSGVDPVNTGSTVVLLSESFLFLIALQDFIQALRVLDSDARRYFEILVLHTFFFQSVSDMWKISS